MGYTTILPAIDLILLSILLLTLGIVSPTPLPYSLVCLDVCFLAIETHVIVIVASWQAVIVVAINT